MTRWVNRRSPLARHPTTRRLGSSCKAEEPLAATKLAFMKLFRLPSTCPIGWPALIYRPTDPQGLSKDYEFSRTTMWARWAQGLSDARTTLLASPWLAP